MHAPFFGFLTCIGVRAKTPFASLPISKRQGASHGSSAMFVLPCSAAYAFWLTYCDPSQHFFCGA